MDPKEILQSKRVLQIFISKVQAIRVCCKLLVIINRVDYFRKVGVFFLQIVSLILEKTVSFKNFTSVNFERRIYFHVINKLLIKYGIYIVCFKLKRSYWNLCV